MNVLVAAIMALAIKQLLPFPLRFKIFLLNVYMSTDTISEVLLVQGFPKGCIMVHACSAKGLEVWGKKLI